MGYQIAFIWSEEAEKELESMGFEKREVYIKLAPGGTTEESNQKGNAEFFWMKHKPLQFITTSYWGAGRD